LTQRERIFSLSTPPVKVEHLIAWPRRKQIKTQGKKISNIFPQLKYTDTVTKNDCVQQEKYDMISLLSYFPPSTPSVKVKQLLHGPRRKKIKTQGEKIYIFPHLNFCALFSVKIKIVGGKL
jgi:hypothetical protein